MTKSLTEALEKADKALDDANKKINWLINKLPIPSEEKFFERMNWYKSKAMQLRAEVKEFIKESKIK